MQKEMPFLSEMPKLRLLDESLIKKCRDEHEAIKLCFDQRTIKYSLTTLAAMLGMDQGHLSCVFAGTKHMPSRRRVMYMQLCGNAAPIQFEAMKLGVLIKPETIEEKAKRLDKGFAHIRKLVKAA
jgi:hypothetical protein